MTINLNVSPYFDDFDVNKKFYKILFRPRFPVQARELNQIQSIFQEQIKRFGDHVFENKSQVIPGEIKYDNRYTWIKINSSFNAENEEQLESFWKNTTITGASGIRAKVVNYLLPNVDNETVLFIKYLQSSTNGEQQEFDPGEALINDDNGLDPIVLNASPNPEGVKGTGSAVHISEGVYYVNGVFTLVSEQTLVLDAFSDKPTARIGLDIVETIVTPEDDVSIKSNALGFASFSAPGAHRLKIDLVLNSRPLNLILSPDPEDEENFIELLRVNNGQIVFIVDRTDYGILEKTLARRTYDESGNYTVKDFRIEMREFYRENGNNGIYEDKDFFFETAAEAEAVAQSRFGLTGWHFDPAGSGKAMPGDTHADFQEAARSLLVVGVEAGKAYVYGYEIETVAKRFIDFPKAREFQHSSSVNVESSVGNFVLVRDVNGFPDITNFSKVDLYDELTTTAGSPNGTKIGEARVRGIEYDSGPIAVNMNNAIFKLFLFDIEMNSGKTFEQVKCIYQDKLPAGVGVEDFSCNINLTEIFLQGTVTQDGSGNLTGVGTFFQSRQSQALLEDDWIVIFEGTNKRYRRVVSTSTDSSATVTPNTGGDAIADASNFAYVFAELKNVGRNTLLFPLSNTPIRSIRDEVNDIRTFITVRREFSVVVGSGQVTLNLTDPYEDFVNFDQDDYFLVCEDGADEGRVYNYNQITQVSYTPSDPGIPQTAQIVFSHPAFVNGDTIRVIATVQKKGSFASQEKQKILIPNEFVNSDVNLINLQEISLGKADIYKINAIYMSDDFVTPATNLDEDITDRYDLDNGQRDNVYDIGRILLKQNQPAPTGRLRIEFQYFQHSNANKNYFSVDSYPIPYADIPSYISSENGLVYDLRDCLDFRPRVNDSGEDFDLITGSLSEIPVRNTVVDYSYYLNRRDKLFLDAEGKFQLKLGTSAIQPVMPSDLDYAMLLYRFDTRAYTFKPKDVLQTKIDNRRYTMRHIGLLEKRIERLEYYTSLSLLEKETADLDIKDENGLDRFKNGFIVDPFEGHGVGDVRSSEYRCSIDMIQKELRPQFFEDNVKLRVNSHANTAQYGDLIMLARQPDIIAIQQPFATDRININPYDVFTFLGNIRLTPELDEWKDTKTLPDLITNIEGNYSQIEAQAEAFGTVWGEWQTHWTGRQVDREVEIQRLFGPNPPDAHHATNWPIGFERTTRTTITRTGTATRTGVRQTVIPEIVTEHLGERVIDVSYIPFMRTRDVIFSAVGLKPSTRMYAFFDGIDVNAYITANTSTYNASNNIDTGTPLITDATGKCNGVFRVPGARRAGFNDTPLGLSFRTGERMFRLTDSPNNNRQRASSSSEVPYRAQGLLETKQSTILAIRNGRLVDEVVAESESVTSIRTKEEQQVRWVDPIAQSFLVTEPGGFYVSKVGVFFETKDDNIPVTLQIRDMVNGYPGQRIFPFGDVTLDALDVNISDDGSIETIFEFPSPVFVPENTEACVVLLANSNEYNVFIANYEPQRNLILGTEIPLTEQAYGGVLFKSSNASTWNADQLKDLKFNLYKAQWQPNQTGSVVLVNDEDDLSFLEILPKNPLQFVAGSNLVRVHHPNHGMPSIPSVQSRVKLTGILETSAGEIAGIPIAEIDDVELIVSQVDLDYYTVEVASNATDSIFAGGVEVLATQNRQMDAMQSIIGELVLAGTSINYGIRTTTSRSPHAPLSAEPYKVQSAYSDHVPNDTIEFSTPRLIASALNETTDVIPGGSKTFFMLASMRTNNANLSPVIDTARMSVVTVANRIENSSHIGSNTTNFAPFDINQILTANTDVEFNSAENTIEVDSDALTIETLRQIQAGRYIEISGGTLNPANVGIFRVIKVEYDLLSSPQLKIFVDAELDTQSGEAVTVTYYSHFVDERSPQEGTASSKYLTRRFVLAQPAIGAKVLLTAYKPSASNIELYYKISKIDEQGRFDDFEWRKAEWDTPLQDSTGVRDYREITSTINNLPEYSILSVKIVFKGINSANVPKCRDLRVVALGT